MNAKELISLNREELMSMIIDKQNAYDALKATQGFSRAYSEKMANELGDVYEKLAELTKVNIKLIMEVEEYKRIASKPIPEEWEDD